MSNNEGERDSLGGPDSGQLPPTWRWDPSMPLQAAPALSQPCPPWCGDTPGHPYDSDDAHDRRRDHSRWYGNDVVVTVSHEAAAYDGPELAATEPVMQVYLVDPPTKLDPGEARALARSLLAAADGLEQITRHHREGHP